MITILFYITIKPQKEREFHDLAINLTNITRTEDEGCLSYVFHRQQGVYPCQYVLYEQWRDQQALDAHVAHLQALLGPPLPGGRLPAALLDLCEKTQVVRYDVVA
jgi:quinol monooxygenase YgiN